MSKVKYWLAFFFIVIFSQGSNVQAQEARTRWEIMNLIRREKFDIVLPKAMRENNIDMWIVMVKRGNRDPLHEDLGGGTPNDKWRLGEFLGYYIFSDRGSDRIERAVLGIDGYTLQHGGAYDLFGSAQDLESFVAERNPGRIGVNMSAYLGVADGLSHTSYLHLVAELGSEYAARLVSAEKLVADFRSHRVASEIATFGKATELTRQILERALSNEVITPGLTTRDDVRWWIQDQMLSLGYSSLANMPSVIYPERATSKDYAIQPGDLLSLDFGIEMLNFVTDAKRLAYVLPEGEVTVPATVQDAFDQSLAVRQIIEEHVQPGRSGAETLELLYRRVEEAGFQRQEIEDLVTDTVNTEVNIGWHSVGNFGHDVGPAIWSDKPFRNELELRPTQLLSFEFFVYAPLPELNGEKLRIGIEDNIVLTENGVGWLSPGIDRILLIH